MKCKAVSFLVGVTAAIGCTKPDLESIVNLNDNKIVVMGHAGMGIASSYDMNTLESIVKCMELGADGTEFDVQMTKDSVLVAYHNEKIEARLNGTGLINEHSFEEIKDLHYVTGPYQQYRLVTVDEIFNYLNNYSGLTITFDCKLYPRAGNTNYLQEFQRQLERLVTENGSQNTILIESQDGNFLRQLKSADSTLHLYYYSDFAAGLEFIVQHDLEGLTLPTTSITREDVALAHERGKKIATWNTHSRKRNREAVEKYPDYIQTDMLVYLLRMTKVP